MMVLMATSGLMVSCKDDDMESITLKRSGNLRVSIKNGESAVANTQIRFSNADTGNELDIVTTDAQGVIDFGKLNEGNYSISFEISNPYSYIQQEFQVVSGENKEYTVQVADYVGTLNVFLKHENSGEIIKEDLNIGVAIIPYSDDFQKAFTKEEIVALAIDKKYFGAEGKLLFDNIPTGYYRIYQILADTIVTLEGSSYVSRLDEAFYSMTVNANVERLYNNHWTVTGAVNYNSGEVIDAFPLESMEFSRLDNIFTMKLANGIIVKGSVYYYGSTSIDLYSYSTNNNDVEVYFSESSFSFDANGKIVLRFSSFEIYDELTNTYIHDSNYTEVTLE